MTNKVGLTLTALVALLAAVYWSRRQSVSESHLHSRMENVLESLMRQEKEQQATLGAPRIAIGYGACQDLFIEAKDLFQGEEPPQTPEHYQEVSDWEQLRKMFTFFFQHGAAAERFVSDEKLFEELISKAVQAPNHRWAVGGNAPVMALRFAREGAQVLLAAKMTPKAKKDLPEGVTIASDHDLDRDDVHLILEYKREETWGQYKSPRANRFILHSDTNNPTVSSLEDFGLALESFAPDLLLVSGLQMMDNFPFKEGQRISRLQKIQDQMKAQSFEKTRIHFEMASFVDETLFKELTQTVIPYADSLGMNEQELPNLFSMLKHGNMTLASDSNPRIAVVLDQMREVYKLLNGGSSYRPDGPRPLTRLHVHTLAYQAIMVEKGSAWKNTRISAAKASLTANRHVCASSTVDLNKAFILMDDSFSLTANVNDDGNETSGPSAKNLRIPFNEERPVACWEEEDLNIKICIAPNLVCSEAQQTAGGGDNISAAGLVMQV